MNFQRFSILLTIIALVVGSPVDLSGYDLIKISSHTLRNSIEIAANSKIAVELESNPTTGYDWYVKNADLVRNSRVIQAINLTPENKGEYEQDAKKREMVGVGGRSYFKFFGLKKGKETVEFVYKRGGETGNFKIISVDFDVIELGEREL